MMMRSFMGHGHAWDRQPNAFSVDFRSDSSTVMSLSILALASGAARPAFFSRLATAALPLIVSWVAPGITSLPALSWICDTGMATSWRPMPTKPPAP